MSGWNRCSDLTNHEINKKVITLAHKYFREIKMKFVAINV